MAHRVQVERQPEGQRPPRRVGEEARDGDAPEVPLAEDAPDRGPAAVAFEVLLLSGDDVVALGRRQPWVLIGRMVERQPQRRPDQADGAGDDERGAPVVGEDRPDHERRREHRADRGADVEESAGETAFARGEPFGRGFHAGRIGAPLREPEQAAQHRQCRPGVGEAVGHADQRPGDGEESEADPQPDHVEHVAADRLQHDRALERADDPGVLLSGDVQVLQDGRGGDAERAARQVVDDRPEHQQRDHPPAQRASRGRSGCHHRAGRGG